MKNNTLGTLSFFAVSMLSVAGCSSTPARKAAASETANEWMISGVAYYRSAAENRALYYQAFNAGRAMVDQDLKIRLKGKHSKRAVIVDCDETILDNSRFEADLIKTGKVYPAGWAEWIEAADAKATPGAVEFLNYVNSKKIDIFYVTNRLVGKESEATIRNLKKLGFPQTENVIGKSDSSSKESRRQKISETHHIVLLAGDTLADLSDAWDKKSIDERNENVDRLKAQFGNRYIVLPNPMYGDWESAIYNYNFKATDAEKSKMRVDAATR